MYKTLFIALALLMVIGVIAAEEVEVEKRGFPCKCRGRQSTYWLVGGPNNGCCKQLLGKCCPD
ncbi:pi/alpha-stichotoxin-Hmg5b-like [Tubulanus polymorphus]|uniref:pi/alpha-stichotoxin-Hmg5b-like n=1 Tax=Tubulanus polymorphus TaxID=672921 RepID=UPI003DA65A98